MTGVWPHGDPHDVARGILAEPRFRGVTAPQAPGPTLLDRLFWWIGDRLHDIFHALGHVLGGSGAFGNVIAILLILVAIAGLIAMFVLFLRLRSAVHPDVRAGRVPLAGAMTSAQLLALARRLASEERWHDAASALVRAALLALDEAGRLRFDPARTAGETRRALRDDAFDAFEREATAALFAAGAATPERFGRLLDAYARMFGVAV